MGELRQRRGPDLRSLQRDSGLVAPPQGYQRIPRQTSRSNRSLHISISLLILAFFVIYANNNRPSKSPYQPGGKKLPKWYALCSKEGKKVYTIPEEGGEGAVECVVVNGQMVADTGSLARVRRKYGDRATIGAVDQAPDEVRKDGGIRIIYLQPGQSLTPGLTDSHGHPVQYGQSLELSLAGTTSKAEVIERVEAFVRDKQARGGLGDRWIEGMGWDQNRWPVQEYPTAADLEASDSLRGLPIVLSRIDVHAIWVSQAVIDALGDLPTDVDGGHIVRDGNGKPTGIFIDNAMDLVIAVRPPWTLAQREGYLEKMMDDALAVGLTGVHDAMTSKADYDTYTRKSQAGSLRLRFYGMVYCEDRDAHCGDDFPMVRSDIGDERLQIRSVKLFGDGALGSRGAALLNDYTDQPGWRGLLLRPEEAWLPVIREWYDKGWQVNVHTIGDRAAKVVLDAIETVLNGRPAERRFRLEHAQILTPADLERSARLGVIASYQPTHATSDMWYAEDRLGKDRMKGAYAWQSYIKLGGRIALGSDFPVESIDPLKGLYAAITRLDENGRSPHGPGGWYSEEKLTRLQALRGMTVDAAYASFSNDTGSLTPGKRFDAVVWDDDLFTAPEDEILEVKVVATLVDGQIAYGKIS